MQISTSRFGTVEIEADDILLFPSGLIGFEDQRHWVLLTDSDNEAVAWLQSMGDPEVAFAVVSPRRFVADYRIRINRSHFDSLGLTQQDRAFVLCIVGRTDDSLTLNLKAPLIVNLDRRIGQQVVTNDDQPLQMELAKAPAPLRKSA